MSLQTAGAIASRSLGTISNQISIVSRNISAAGTPGASEKLALLATDDLGVGLDSIGRATNGALFRSLLSANGDQGAARSVSEALDRIDQALDLSNASNSRSPASLIARLTSALQSYSATPGDETSGQIALSAAKDVAAKLRDATAVTQDARRDADARIDRAVADVNDLLAKFEAVNAEVVSGSAARADVTDALDQRDGLLTQLSASIGIRTVTRAHNDIVIYTDSGVTLFETQPRTVTFQQTPNLAPGTSGAAVYIDGVQVTGVKSPLALQSGEISGLSRLRDVLAPQYQRQLDETARALVVAFAEEDQSGSGGPPLAGLFTYAGASTAPGAALIGGLAGAIEVNAAVDPSVGGDLSRLRDGGVSGNSDYVYNASGASGYSTRILQLVEAAATPLALDPIAELGTRGSVASIASSSNGWFAAQRQQHTRDNTYSSALSAQATQALSNSTGVNLDEQMSRMLSLESSYQASARLLETVNGLFNTLLAALRA
ncbi:MAG: flagellar hook-associated protein FlgK [Methylocystis sp.]|nr:MAG: flagellar hook-associated protein FlgK [Methylocystis sp.]